MNPIDEIMKVIVQASHEVRKLLKPIRQVVAAVKEFVKRLDAEIQQFVDALKNNDAAKCALAIFEPLTEVFDLATCIPDEAIGAAFQAATLGLQTVLIDLVNKASSDLIR